MFKKYFSSPQSPSSFPVALVEQEISCTQPEKKYGRAKWGGKIFGVPKGSREREPVMYQILSVAWWRYGAEKLNQIWVPLNTVDYLSEWIIESLIVCAFYWHFESSFPRGKEKNWVFVKWLENEKVLVAHYFDTASVEKQRFLKQLIYKHIPICSAVFCKASWNFIIDNHNISNTFWDRK